MGKKKKTIAITIYEDDFGNELENMFNALVAREPCSNSVKDEVEANGEVLHRVLYDDLLETYGEDKTEGIYSGRLKPEDLIK